MIESSLSPLKSFRICMSAGHFLPNIGGVERYILHFSQSLKALGAEIAVVSTLLDGTKPRECVDGLEIFRLPAWMLAGGRFPIPKHYSKEFKHQLRELDEWDPNLAILHTYIFPQNILMSRYFERRKVPMVLINHGSGYVDVGNPVLNFGLHKFERYAARVIGSRCAKKFGVSQAAADWLKTFGLLPDGVIPNGVDMRGLPPRDIAFRERIGVPRDACLIAYAARLLPEKGADTLLSVFNGLSDQYPNLWLAIAGEGPAMQTLKRLSGANARVRLLGAQAHKDVLSLFGASDIMAYPSRYVEGLPTSILEAGGMGCSVVATPQGGTAELISNDEVGIIVRTKSELDKAIRLLVESPDHRNKVAQALRERIAKEYDWPIIAENAMKVLPGVIV